MDLVIIDFIELIKCDYNVVCKKDFYSCILNKLFLLVKEYNITIIAISLLCKTDNELAIRDFLDENTSNNLDNLFYLFNKDNKVYVEVFNNVSDLPVKVSIELF